MKKIVFIFLILSQVVLCGYSQASLDSLQAVWQNENLADSLRLEALQAISWKVYLYSQPDSALYYAQIHYEYAQAKDLKAEMAAALNTQGVALWIAGKYSSALDHYFESLSLWKETNDLAGMGKTYNNIGIIYKQQGDYQKALTYYQKSLNLSDSANDRDGKAKALNNIGILYKKEGNYSEALNYYLKSLAIEESLDSKKGETKLLNNIGVIYAALGNYSLAIHYYDRSLKLKESLGDKLGVSNTLNNIGISYFELGDYEKALEYYEKSLALKQEVGNALGIASTQHNIAQIYVNQSHYEMAETTFQQALNLNKEIDHQSGVAQCLASLGKLYMNTGQNNKAIDNLQRSVVIHEKTGNKEGLITSLQYLGNYYADKGQFNEALKYSNRALSLAQEAGNLLQTRNLSWDLYTIHKQKNNFQKALEMHEAYLIANDSLLSEENQRQLIRQEFQYNYEKQAVTDSIDNAKALQLQALTLEAEQYKNKKQQQLAYYLFAGIFVLSFLLVLLFYGYRLSNKRKAIIEAQKLEVDEAYAVLRNKNLQIEKQSYTLQQVNEEVNTINDSLEGQVKARSMQIEELNQKLKQYAFSNSHEVRGPLARILGLLNLYKNDIITPEERENLVEKITISAFELDQIINKLTKLLNEEERGSL